MLEHLKQIRTRTLDKCETDKRGTGEWTKGQHSWNISVTNEVRGGGKGIVGIVNGMPILGNPFLLMKTIA